MIGLDPWNILSWKKYIFKHQKCIFKLKKVENTIYIDINHTLQLLCLWSSWNSKNQNECIIVVFLFNSFLCFTAFLEEFTLFLLFNIYPYSSKRFGYLCNQMMYTFDISNLDYLMPQNSKFEISTIYDKNAEIRKSKTQFFNI